jgi:hypothetical protein
MQVANNNLKLDTDPSGDPTGNSREKQEVLADQIRFQQTVY